MKIKIIIKNLFSLSIFNYKICLILIIKDQFLLSSIKFRIVINFKKKILFIKDIKFINFVKL